MSLDGLIFSVVAIVGLLLILTPLVLFHELGHFITARMAGITVHEFGIGFPPRARVLGRDHETEYTLNYLPIGGFVRLEGEETDSDDPRAFSNAGLPKQLIVLVAGVSMNLIAAALLFFVVAWAFNPVVQPSIAQVVKDSPAEIAGLQPGDTLISIDGRTHSVIEFAGTDATAGWRQDLLAHGGQTVSLVVADSTGKRRTVNVTLRVPKAGEGALGVSMSGGVLTTSAGDPVSAIGVAVPGTGRAVSLVLGAIADLFGQFATNPTKAPNAEGPVGIAVTVGHVASEPNALMLLLLLAGVLSANLALFNILPLPVLDGGKMVIMVVKRIFGARGVSAFEAFTYVASFAVLMAFVGWITFFDILRVSGH